MHRSESVNASGHVIMCRHMHTCGERRLLFGAGGLTGGRWFLWRRSSPLSSKQPRKRRQTCQQLHCRRRPRRGTPPRCPILPDDTSRLCQDLTGCWNLSPGRRLGLVSSTAILTILRSHRAVVLSKIDKLNQMYGVAAHLHVLESGQVVFALGRAGTPPLNGRPFARFRWRDPASKPSHPILVAALDPAFPNQQPDFSDFQWPSTSRVGGRQGETEREVKAGAKEQWSKHNESALSGDTPLPLPLAYPGIKPTSQKEIDAMLNCDPELENCKDPVYQWMAKCSRCQGTGEVSFYRKRGKEVISKCIACSGIGYVQRITYRADKADDSDLSNYVS